MLTEDHARTATFQMAGADGAGDVGLTGTELFTLAGELLESVSMCFNFTHAVLNQTTLAFADTAFVLEKGAVAWAFGLDGGWPFPTTSATSFTLATTVALDSRFGPIGAVRRLVGSPRPGRTTYVLEGSGGGSTQVEIDLVVFDVAVADGRIVDIDHKVELTTLATEADQGRAAQELQAATFLFTFPSFQDSLAYQPEVVLVVIDGGGGSGGSGGLIAGIVALLVVIGLVLVAIVRAHAVVNPPVVYHGAGTSVGLAAEEDEDGLELGLSPRREVKRGGGGRGQKRRYVREERYGRQDNEVEMAEMKKKKENAQRQGEVVRGAGMPTEYQWEGIDEIGEDNGRL